MKYYFEVKYKSNEFGDSNAIFRFEIVAENDQKALRAAYAMERLLCKNNPWFERADFIQLKQV
jgi:hypothetical protein